MSDGETTMEITITLKLSTDSGYSVARQLQYALSGLLHEAHGFELPSEITFHLPASDYGRVSAAEIEAHIDVKN